MLVLPILPVVVDVVVVVVVVASLKNRLFCLDDEERRCSFRGGSYA